MVSAQEVTSFNVNIDVRVQLRIKSKMFMPDDGNGLILFNFDAGMCQVGSFTTYDGMHYHWQMNQNYPIREAHDGLQYFDFHGFHGWKYFDEKVQEAYAQYALEREIK